MTTAPRPRIGRPARATDDVLAMIDDAVDAPFQVGPQHAGDASYGVAIDAGLCWRCLQADADPSSPAELCTSCSSEVAADEYVAPVEDPPDVAYMAAEALRPRLGSGFLPGLWPDVTAPWQWPSSVAGLFRILWTPPVDDPFAGLELTLFPRVGTVERWARRVPTRARVRVQLGVMAFAHWLLRKAGETPPPPPARAPQVHTVSARQTGHRLEAMARIADELGVPRALIGLPETVIIDDPPPRPEARSAMRQVLAQHYAGTPLCHAIIERDGTIVQGAHLHTAARAVGMEPQFTEFVTQVAPDQEDPADA